MKTNLPRVLISTGIFPPDIGGPSTYAHMLMEQLQERGYYVQVVHFGPVRNLPAGIRHLAFFFDVMKKMKKCDTVIVLDEFSVGFPTTLANIFRRKKVLIRLGGDFLWEKSVEEKGFDDTLRAFYKTKSPRIFFPFLSRLVGWALRSANVVVYSTSFYKNLMAPYYGLSQEKTRVITNAFSSCKKETLTNDTKKDKRVLLFAGRLKKVKNIPLFIDVFSDIVLNDKKGHYGDVVLTLYGRGQEESRIRKKIEELPRIVQERISLSDSLSRDDLLLTMKSAYACVLPSLTEPSPHFAHECNMLGVPALVTNENGIHDDLSLSFFVDPKNKKEMKAQLENLLDPHHYREKKEKSATVSKRDVAALIDEWIPLL